jgi:hypothetical protein
MASTCGTIWPHAAQSQPLGQTGPLPAIDSIALQIRQRRPGIAASFMLQVCRLHRSCEYRRYCVICSSNHYTTIERIDHNVRLELAPVV